MYTLCVGRGLAADRAWGCSTYQERASPRSRGEGWTPAQPWRLSARTVLSSWRNSTRFAAGSIKDECTVWPSKIWIFWIKIPIYQIYQIYLIFTELSCLHQPLNPLFLSTLCEMLCNWRCTVLCSICPCLRLSDLNDESDVQVRFRAALVHNLVPFGRHTWTVQNSGYHWSPS